MSQIALKEYLSKIEALLDENLLAEATAHCHFILQQHPRHVDAYRLLGRALLEQQYYREAIDVFYRILGADPEDLVARAGLSIALRENGELEKAIWHMERAFEIDPYNVAVREELSELYRRANVERSLELNRPALARLYTRSGLYQLAISELRSLVGGAEDRFDLRVLMTESLYWDGNRAEAIKKSLEIVRTLPDCIKANAILAETWLKAGQASNAQKYIRRLTALTAPTHEASDSETLIGRAISCYPPDDLPEQIMIEALDYVPVQAQEWRQAEQWAEGEALSISSDDESPHWLHEISDVSSQTSMESALSGAGEEALDWLEDLAGVEDSLILDEELAEDERSVSKMETSIETPSDFAQDFSQDRTPVAIDDYGGVEEEAGFLESSPESSDTDELVDVKDDLDGLDIPLEEELKKALMRDRVEEKPTIDADDSFTNELLRELEMLSEESEEEAWQLGGEPVGDDLFESPDDWLDDLADSSQRSSDVPDWLFKAAGLSGEAETKKGDEELGWLSQPGETGKVSPPFETEGAESTEEQKEPVAGEVRDADEGAGGPTDGEQASAGEGVGGDLQELDLPDWLVTEKDAEKEAEEAGSNKDTEESIYDLESIPWLDELGEFPDAWADEQEGTDNEDGHNDGNRSENNRH